MQRRQLATLAMTAPKSPPKCVLPMLLPPKDRGQPHPRRAHLVEGLKIEAHYLIVKDKTWSMGLV